LLPPDLAGIRSLGWRVADWCEEYLAQPDGDLAGDPFRFTDEQLDFVVRWFAVDDQGRWRYRRAQLVRPKGWGKSPLVAALGCAALGGPVVFDGFDAAGAPVGRPHPSPWVQLAGVSEDQTVNTMSLVLAMLRERDAASVMPGLDLGLTRIFTARGRLEPVTASAPSREGQRLTEAILDETQHWMTANGGHRLAATIRRNLAKMGGRSVETTNAWCPGEGSVAEVTAEYAAKIERGLVRDPGLFTDHILAPADTDLRDEKSLRRGLKIVYGDATWIDLDRIVAEVYDPGTHPADARRFYLNQITAAEDAWVSPQAWDKLADAGLVLHDHDEIALGFDGSRTDDATALVACRIPDGALFLLHVQAAPTEATRRGEWEVDRDQVDGAVRQAFDRYDVAAMFSDVHPWESYVDAWSRDFGSGLRVKATERSAVGYDMRSRGQQFTRAAEGFAAAIEDGEIRHDGDATLREHIHNARRRVNRFGVTLGKEHRESNRKVDAAVAAVLARAARQEVLARGARRKRRGTGKVVVLS
jgi:hypothetical protein